MSESTSERERSVVAAAPTNKTGTYRTFDEVEEVLSPHEQRLEKLRRTVGLFVGPIAGVVVYLLTSGLDDPAQKLAGILTFVIVYWISEAIPIPVTAMLALGLVVITGVAGGADVFALFGSPTLFVFIGGFIIAESMQKYGLDRRFAFSILALPGVGSSTTRIIIAFGAITALLSAFVSNTATAAMMMPIAAGIVGFLASVMARNTGKEIDPRRLRFATALMLMVAYGASIGGLLTPVGSPPNLIGRGLIEQATGETIPFFTWMLLAFPIVAVMFIALSIVLIMLNRPEFKRIEGVEEYVRTERAKLGKMGTGGRNTLIAFAVAVTLWITPGVVGLFTGGEGEFYDLVAGRLNEGVVAIVAASLLFLLPVDFTHRKFTVTWNDAARIDWGTIILFGSGIALGGLLGSTGLAEAMGGALSDMLGVQSLLGLTLLATIIAVIISETTSNTASVGVVVPIVIPLADAAGVNPLIPAVAAIFGASFGFMLPVSTPPNAIVYGTGMVPITKMVRSGIVFDVIGIILIVAGVMGMGTLLGLGT
ncbi:DASS family sodium-coupled anion symporter [Georgenia sp. 311]|uniref:Sodium-dependent dicarboxylate transporter SdcS n=1 Tax=Georgenia wutianyii TaxID=2585135 RepID=A0ABX5VPU2_9MICO|nr:MULTISPECIES: DASS family sodium-coupled anion symporter [Georgenia]QDB80524.1 DASS family sodium-coupled anion symporter [Georgenia wutianyii]TNC18264.1 DASS family sodium-coupled anion symporter [Georgenia sp. 311]